MKSYPVHYFKKVGKIELDPKYPFRNIQNVGCVMITAESPEDALAVAIRAGYHAFKVSRQGVRVLDDVTKRVYRFKKTCRFLGRIETIEGYRYMPFEVTNHETGRVYKGRLPLTKLPAALKEGVLHIGKYNQLVPFDLINDWVCGVMV